MKETHPTQKSRPSFLKHYEHDDDRAEGTLAHMATWVGGILAILAGIATLTLSLPLLLKDYLFPDRPNPG